jgi:hypothetical protein
MITHKEKTNQFSRKWNNDQEVQGSEQEMCENERGYA